MYNNSVKSLKVIVDNPMKAQSAAARPRCLASQSCSQIVLRAVATSGRLLGAPWPWASPA